jgi:hypothetical protein
MKLLDRIALNRSMIIVFNFILSLLKLFMPKVLDDTNPVPPVPKPPLRRKPRLPVLKKEDKQ